MALWPRGAGEGCQGVHPGRLSPPRPAQAVSAPSAQGNPRARESAAPQPCEGCVWAPGLQRPEPHHMQCRTSLRDERAPAGPTDGTQRAQAGSRQQQDTGTPEHPRGTELRMRVITGRARRSPPSGAWKLAPVENASAQALPSARPRFPRTPGTSPRSGRGATPVRSSANANHRLSGRRTVCPGGKG